MLDLTNPNNWLIEDFSYELVEDDLDYYEAISMCKRKYEIYGFVHATKIC